MLISRRNHAAIVAQFEARIAELTIERNFYRDAWTERLGMKFIFPSGVARSEAQARSSALEVSERPERIDANWSPDDRDILFDWARSNLPGGEDPLQAWEKRYGAESPVKVAIAGAW